MLNKWQTLQVKALDQQAQQAAEQRQTQLTKPPGSLGRLETLAVQLAAMQGCELPACERVHIAIFAADHGVAAQGVSAFPQSVTAQMVLNFAAGGAAVTVLAREMGATFRVVNLGTVAPAEHSAVLARQIAPQTADFSQTAAMSEEQLAEALAAGEEQVSEAVSRGTQLFIAGEMGIANTTAAAALIAMLQDYHGVQVAGPGTGVKGQALAHKATVIDKALALHRPQISSPLQALQRLGGFEIAAMTGAYLSAAREGLPVLVDGFISTVAAYIATLIVPASRDWMLFGHRSAEPFHQTLLQQMQAEPILDLDMRLGEGSGAAMAVSVLRSACALHKGMATFSGAGVDTEVAAAGDSD